jgi:hypothetical protein
MWKPHLNFLAKLAAGGMVSRLGMLGLSRGDAAPVSVVVGSTRVTLAGAGGLAWLPSGQQPSATDVEP